MKIIRKNPAGETRELLLKEYFLNAYLIALLKGVGDEVRRVREKNPQLGDPIAVRNESR